LGTLCRFLIDIAGSLLGLRLEMLTFSHMCLCLPERDLKCHSVSTYLSIFFDLVVELILQILYDTHHSIWDRYFHLPDCFVLFARFCRNKIWSDIHIDVLGVQFWCTFLYFVLKLIRLVVNLKDISSNLIMLNSRAKDIPYSGSTFLTPYIIEG